MACGDFESEIGNALKALLAGLAVGATASLILEATKAPKKHEKKSDEKKKKDKD